MTRSASSDTAHTQNRSNCPRHGVRSMSAEAATPHDQRHRISPKGFPTSGNVFRNHTPRNRTHHLLLMRPCTALWDAGQTVKGAASRFTL